MEEDTTTIKYEIDEKYNPWAVDHLEEFLFFCCPECPDKISTKASFINHALIEHPKAREVIPAIEIADDNDEEIIKDSSKTESEDEYDKDNEDDQDDEDMVDDDLEDSIEEMLQAKVQESLETAPKKNTRSASAASATSTAKVKSQRKSNKDKEDSLTIVQCYFCSEMLPENGVKSHMYEFHGRYLSSMYGEKRPYQCHVCKASLKQDLKDSPSHHCYIKLPRKKAGVNGHPCNLCSKVFKMNKGLSYHIKSVHSTERPFKCTQCDYTAKSNVLLFRHVQRMHENLKPHVCHICGLGFFEQYFMRKHIEAIHKNGVKPRQRSDITTGMHSTATVKMLCGLCSKPFFSLRALRCHNMRVHEGKKTDRYACETCGMAFTNLYYLNRHIKIDHTPEEEIAKIICQCEKCSCEFQSSFELNTHLEICCLHDLKNFKCDTCETNNWHSGIALRRHIAEAHRNIRDVCNICGVILKSNCYLKLHIQQVHDKETSDKTCDKCGRGFSSDASLRRHIESVHYKLKPYSCDKCDNAFSNHSLLKKHEVAVHLKTTKYECKHCKYFTYRPGALRTHTRIVHEKAKPNKCDYCEMAFFYKRDKIKHMLKHNT
jgi:hypothetical protein